MLKKTPCFTQLLNSNWNGLNLDDPDDLIIQTEMSSYPWDVFLFKYLNGYTKFWFKVWISFEIFSGPILTVLSQLFLSNQKLIKNVVWD